MRLFFDTVWKLHIGEIPEKPHEFIDEIEQYDIWEEYRNKIAAIKQNALTVGNPEILNFEHGEEYDTVIINGDEINKGEFYKWVGGYEKKKIQVVENWGYQSSTVTSTSALKIITVAILILPEEKTKLKLSEFECADCGATINEGEYVTFGVCDKCFQKNYRERFGLPEEKKNTMENSEGLNAWESLGNEINKISVLQDAFGVHPMLDVIKQRGTFDLQFAASGSVAAPKPKTEGRWFKLWKKITESVIPKGPMCRDCADEDGTCPNNDGLPCDPTDEVIERFKRLRQQLEGMKSILKEVEFQVYAEGWSPQERLAEIKKKFPKR